MSPTAYKLRRALAGIRRHPSGRGHRYPRALRTAVTVYVRRCRARGEPWAAITGELGLSAFTLQRWLQTSAVDTFRPVEVVVAEPPPAASGAVVVLPGGVRIEGLDLAGLVAVARALR